MTSSSKSLAQLVDASERLGVLGSPSSTTELSIDILGSAATRKLVGEFALFRFPQDDAQNYALGQITAVQLKNPWHEDPTMRSLIRQRGRVDAVSERQDTHLALMEISAVFEETSGGFEPNILGTVPSTGTTINVATDDVLSNLLADYEDQLFYLGRVYGSTPRLPLWFKHFDSGPSGAGEAYHLGIFGKTGSGKSVLAKMLLVAYSRHSRMGALVLDPQGEFSQDLSKGSVPGEFELPFGELLRRNGRPVHVVSVRNLVLDQWDLFSEILYESPFFEKLTMPKGENRRIACVELADGLQKKRVRLDQLASDVGYL
ncbi:MAG: helicase HerA domain-containing protein, partial [Candidatus Binatia bacterium]